MNQSEGVFLGNTDQGGGNWPCELPCAFAQSTARPFLLRSPALGTQPAAGRAPALLWCSLSPQRGSRGKPHPEDTRVWDGCAGAEESCSCPASCLGQVQDGAEPWWLPSSM